MVSCISLLRDRINYYVANICFHYKEKIRDHVLVNEGNDIFIHSILTDFTGLLFHRCMLHNFAGNIEMYGVLDAVSAGPVDARTSKNSTMVI